MRVPRIRCPHSNLRAVNPGHGTDDGWRLWCADCGRFLAGPVSLAEARKGEADE